MVVVIGFAIVFFKGLHRFQGTDVPNPSPGTSSAAKEASRIAARHFPQEVLKAMDLSADPCSDFYTYACGTFQEITEIEPDQNEWARAWSGVSARNNELLREVIETDHGLAGDFYKSCMNMSAIDAMGNEPIQPYRKELETLKSCEARSDQPFARFHKAKPKCGIHTLQPLIVKWQLIDIKVFFDWSVEVNPHKPDEYALNLMQDGITLPDPKWYYSGTADAEAKVAGLQRVAEKVFVLAGESVKDAKAEAADLVAFERALAQLFKDAQDERTATQGIFTLADLDRMSPGLGLPDTLRALAGPYKVNLDKVDILIRNPDYLRGVNTLVRAWGGFRAGGGGDA